MFRSVPLSVVRDSCIEYLVRSHYNSSRKRRGPLPLSLHKFRIEPLNKARSSPTNHVHTFIMLSQAFLICFAVSSSASLVSCAEIASKISLCSFTASSARSGFDTEVFL